MAAGLALAGCSSEPSCAEQVKQNEAAVRTNHHLENDDLPGVGDYVEVHWQIRAAGDPCSRVIGPTDLRYQDVIVMREADAAALKAAWDWQPVTGPTPSAAHQVFAAPADIWPALAEYLPKSARWTHSDAYDKAGFSGQNRSAYLDPDHTTLLVFTFDY
jgi:hypothetical protein